MKLYALPDPATSLRDLTEHSIAIRLAKPGETRTISSWVAEYFSDSWGVGCEWAISRDPISCYIAIEQGDAREDVGDPYESVRPEKLVGFACYDAAAKGIFGAMGVHPDYNDRGIGRGLILKTLNAMAADGYVYAIVGWAGEPEFYEKTVGATIIPDSEPSIFGVRLTGGI